MFIRTHESLRIFTITGNSVNADESTHWATTGQQIYIHKKNPVNFN